jgi:hypothetical protein
LRERLSVGLEDELTDKVSGILQPDTGSERVGGVHHFVLVDLGGHMYLFLALGGEVRRIGKRFGWEPSKSTQRIVMCGARGGGKSESCSDFGTAEV